MSKRYRTGLSLDCKYSDPVDRAGPIRAFIQLSSFAGFMQVIQRTLLTLRTDIPSTLKLDDIISSPNRKERKYLLLSSEGCLVVDEWHFCLALTG